MFGRLSNVSPSVQMFFRKGRRKIQSQPIPGIMIKKHLKALCM